MTAKKRPASVGALPGTAQHLAKETNMFERIPGRRAEALDCVVYAFAARQIIHSNWAAREDALRNPEASQAVSRPREIPSAWMKR